MPPVLSAKQMFWAGAALLVAGFVLDVGVNTVVFTWDALGGWGFTAIAVAGQALVTVGAVLLASSPIAKRIEVRDAERERVSARRVPLP
jgi:hypothetical protein